MERLPAKEWLNTFANLVLTKDNEGASPRYEYFDLVDEVLKSSQAEADAQEIERSLSLLTFSSQDDIPAQTYYYIRLVGEDMEIISSSSIPEEEIENGQVFGPFKDMETLQYYLSKTREKI